MLILGNTFLIMKRLFGLLVLMMTVLLFFSCKSTLPKRMDSFVNSVEQSYKSYTQEDWDIAKEKFQKLKEEYKDNKDNFSEDQKKQINSAITKFNVIMAKSGFDDVIEAIEDICSKGVDKLEEAYQYVKNLTISDSTSIE